MAIETEKLRAWYSHRQGLDGRLSGAKPAEVLEQAGWARSVGGVSPYLTMFSRAGTTREAADAAVAKLDLHEIPAARACTYVVPAADFGLALKAGQAFAGGDLKVAYKLGVTEKEIDTLCAAVMKALGSKTLDPEEIREGVGSAARSLGEEGKKKGVSTTLPLALGKLQNLGEIRRVPMNGRLDHQRYKYTVWRPNPLAKFKMGDDEVAVELARRYFQWIGPASLAEFQWFSGLGVKAAKTAIEPLKLGSLAAADDRLLLPEHASEFASFKPPEEARYSLVGSLDSISLLRRDLKRMLDPADLARDFFRAQGKAGETLMDLPSHAILDRGRIVGLWEYDTATESIAWVAFIKKTRELEQAVARTEAYIREQLGDARSFSLDSTKSREPKIAALRKAAGK